MAFNPLLEDLSCNLCGKDFLSNKALKTHTIKYHKEDTVSCDECGKEVKNKNFLRSHMQSHDFENCTICDKSLKKKSLPNHMKVHEKDNQNRYEECNATFSRLESLTRHQNS